VLIDDTPRRVSCFRPAAPVAVSAGD